MPTTSFRPNSSLTGIAVSLLSVPALSRISILQAARVQRHREAVDGIGEQVTQDRLRLSGLGQEDVDWPDRVARSLPELDEEHLAADKLVDLGVLELTVVAARVLRP